MKSNEEYLDELLKAMVDDSGSTSTPEIPQGAAEHDSNETSMEENNSDVFSTDEEVQDTLSESSLEQLMAEVQKSSQDFEDIDFSDDDMMSEESIDALLNEAKASAQMIAQEAPAEESFDLNDHEDLAEINELLDKDERKEIIEEVELPAEEAALSMEDMAAMEIPIETEQEFSMEDLDSLLEDRSVGESTNKKEKKKWGKTAKEENIGAEASEEEPKGFRKFLSLLFEEEPDEMDPEEAKDMNLSEENREILSQLDKEDKAKAKVKNKKKKDKNKGKNGEEEEEGNRKKKKAKKAPKPKKEKKLKKEKPVKEESNERPEKLLPKKKVIITSIFAASLLVAILLLEFLIPPMFTLNDARTAFQQQDYKAAYKEFYGENLNEGDEESFQSSRAVMRMQTNLDSYYSFIEIGDEVKALHYLIEGVHARDDVYALAEGYSATADVEKVYMEILAILSADYGLTQEDALEIIAEKSDLVYTKKLQAIVNGTEYVESSASEISQKDMLPEEEEIFQEPMQETTQDTAE